MDMRLAEFSPSCGLWPVTEDALLDEIFQTEMNCRGFGGGLVLGQGHQPCEEGLKSCKEIVPSLDYDTV